MDRVTLNRRAQVDRPLTWGEMDSNWQKIAEYLYSIGVTSENAEVLANQALLVATESPLSGVATPAGTPTVVAGTKASFIASEVGTYPNYGGLEVNTNELAIFYFDGTSWTKTAVSLDMTGYATKDDLASYGSTNFNPMYRWTDTDFGGNVLRSKGFGVDNTVSGLGVDAKIVEELEQNTFNYRGNAVRFVSSVADVRDWRLGVTYLSDMLSLGFKTGDKIRVTVEVFIRNMTGSLPFRCIMDSVTVAGTERVYTENGSHIYNSEFELSIPSTGTKGLQLFFPRYSSTGVDTEVVIGRVYFGLAANGSIDGDNNVYRSSEAEKSLLQVKSNVEYTTAFDLSLATAAINNLTNVIWCNDYWAKDVLGIRTKARAGTLNIHKLNTKTKEHSLIKSVEIAAESNGVITDILFDEKVTLSEFERIGINGYLYYSNNVNLPLYPNMYTLKSNGNIIYQTDATMAYNLIIPDRSKEQVISDKVEQLTFDTNVLAKDLQSKPIATILTTLTNGYGASNYSEITTGSYLQIPVSGLIPEVTINTQANIVNHIVVGTVINNFFYEKDRAIIVADKDGLITQKVSLNVTKGDYIGFYKTSRFMYRANGATAGVEDSRFLQFGYPHKEMTPINVQGWVGLSYRLQENHAFDIDALANGYETGIFKSGIIAPRDSYVAISADKWLTFTHSPFSYDGAIKKLLIDVETAGDVIIGVGIIDQRGWAIIDKQQTVNCPKAGLNEIAVNITLTENQRLFLKGGISIGVSTNGMHLETGAGNIVLGYVAGEILFKYEIEGKRFVSSNLATIQQLNDVKEDISKVDEKVNNIGYETMYLQSPDGSYWKQSIDNNGAVTWVKVQSKKVSVFGNSFELHPITSLWWGRFGMAASKRENDWVHVLMRMLKSDGILTTITPYSIAETGWETNPDTFDYSRLDPYLPADLDLAIVRIGENVPTSLIASLGANCKTLIDYIKSKSPNAKIIWGGVFWTNQAKQDAMYNAIQTYGDIPFIDFQPLDIAEYKSAIGNQVFGDDGQWHTINHAGVANHAGDKGQYTMAEMIKPYAVEVLK